MIYVRLAGGLGNQLFQLAAAVEVSRRTGRLVVPLIDALSGYAQERQPDSLRLVSAAWLRSPPLATEGGLAHWLVSKARVGRWLPLVGINDRNWPTVSARQFVAMDGYFQRGWTKERFEGVLKLLAIRPPSHEASEALRPKECVVHVRGGDFLTHALHQVVDGRYYVTAAKLALAAGWRHFALMTDDPVHAAGIAEVIGRQVGGISMRTLSPSKDPLDDLAVLRAAPVRIIGNSTFAWWATALDTQRGRTWSPSKLLHGLERDFFLDWEQPIPV